MAYDDLSDYSEDFEDEVTSSHEQESIHGQSHASLALADEQYYSSGYHSTGRLVTGGSTAHNKPPAATKGASFSSSTTRGMRKSHGGSKKGKSPGKSLSIGKSPAGQSPRDRLLSAKQHAVKDLQSKLAVTVQVCDDLKKENKLLRMLQARQEKELEKYQSQEGELPQILTQHSEEVRILKEQLKRSQASLAAHQGQLKDYQQRILHTSERNKKLEALVKKKDLLEREMLTYQLQETQLAIINKEKKISDLEKSADLIAKSHQREAAQLRVKNKSLNAEIKKYTDQHKQLCHHLKEKERDLDVLNIYSKRLARTSTNLTLPLPVYAEDAATMTDISCPPADVLVLGSQCTSPQDQFSNTANYSPRQTTGSIFTTTLSYPQGSSGMTSSLNNSTDNSPRSIKISSSEQIPKSAASTTATTVTATNFSLPAQTTHPVKVIDKHRSPDLTSKEEMSRLEELQRKKTDEEQLRLQRAQEEKERVQREAEEKRLEEKKKQELLAKLQAVDEQSQSQPTTNKTPQVENPQPVKKKRLEDILNDGNTNQEETVTTKEVNPLLHKSNSLEERRKKERLARLLSTDQSIDATTSTFLVDDGLMTVGSTTSIKSASSTGSNYKWNNRIENMHQGKPALSSKDDPFGKRASAGLRKGSLTLLDDGASNQGKKSDSGLDFLGGTGGGTVNTNLHHSQKNNTPTFGRRAVQKPHPVFGSEIVTSTEMPLLVTAATNQTSSRSYPWEQEVNMTSEHNTMNYLSHSDAPADSLLPRRAKAKPPNISSVPGQISDEDIEELSLV